MEGGKTRIYKQNLSRLIRLPDFFGITDSSGLMPLSRIWDNGIINNGKQPTVADLEQQAKSGQPISLMDLAAATLREERDKKKSVMEQLKSQPRTEHKKKAPQKSAEREI